jgi:excinuclease ABC subunit A
VDYLTLDRTASSLSVGEAQRIRLASQIGTGLTGVLYVLDEPTVGLHQRDTKRLIKTLKRLRDLGNTVVVVEHDQEVLNSADWIIDFGPGAGKKGGQIVAANSPAVIKKNRKSLTGLYLSGGKKVKAHPDGMIKEGVKYLNLTGCQEHNLKNLTVKFPLNRFVCITGVSGSGKSTLIHETLYPALKKSLDPYYRQKPGQFEKITGFEAIDHVYLVDQSPIGRTSRSNPATYTGIFTEIRELFAQTREAQLKGFTKSHFSFNVTGGRCEACRGQGMIKVEMQFIPDIWVTCEECGGTRFKSEVLEVEYKERNIHEVLKLTLDEALKFFGSFPKIVRRLKVLEKIGLEYLELGQPSPTLSGGESQRLKLARELVRPANSRTLYLLDEPTTGLHFADIEQLLVVIRELVDKGNTVIIIEHNLDVVKNADWIIDLGPEGGEKGGRVVTQGSPRKITQNSKSFTGKYLKKALR